MMELGLLDSSRKVTHICEKVSQILRLVLHACIRLFVKKIYGVNQTWPQRAQSVVGPRAHKLRNPDPPWAVAVVVTDC